MRAALLQLQAALGAEPAFEPATTAHTFTLGLSDYGAVVVLPPLLQRLDRIAPGVKLRVQPLTGAPLSRAFEEQNLDVMVGRFSQVPAAFRRQLLFRDRMMTLVGPGAFRSLTRGRLTVAQFANARHTVVHGFGDGPAPVDKALHERGLSRQITLSVPFFLAAPLVARSSDVLVTLPERLGAMFENSEVRLVKPPVRLPGFDMTLIWQATREHEPALTWFRSLLREAFEPGAASK